MDNTNKIDALRIIAAKSINAVHDAVKTIQAIDLNSPMAQRRYNHTVEIALNDPAADFTPGEQATILSEMDTVSGLGRPTLYGETMRQTAIYLPEDMIAWLNQQPGNMSVTIRELITRAMQSK
jgi:hypothetical protein